MIELRKSLILILLIQVLIFPNTTAIQTDTHDLNLTVVQIDGPSSAHEGETISLTGTLRHEGTDQVVFDVDYAWYLSTDTIIDTSDTELDQGTIVQFDYATDESVSTTTSLPVGETGTYYLGLLVDINFEVSETDEDDNWMATSSFTISETPDLIADSVSGPSLATGGDTISVTMEFSNQGSASASGFYINAGLTSSTSGSPIHSMWTTYVSSSFSPGASWGPSSYDMDVPVGITPGSYYFVFEVDSKDSISEISESNNMVYSSTQISVSSPYDVVAKSISKAPVANAGTTTSITSEVENMGSESISFVYVAIYLSTDNTITSSDTILGSYYINSLDVSDVNSTTDDYYIPTPTSGGDYYIGMLVDPLDSINEFDENNNDLASTTTISISGTIDLTPTGITAPSYGNPGGNVSISISIQNVGSVTSSSFSYTIYISSDTNIEIYDTSLASGTISSLDDTTSVQHYVILPNTEDTYYFGVIVDDLDEVVEANEINNIIASSAIQIQPTDGNDDFVSSASISDTFMGSINSTDTHDYYNIYLVPDTKIDINVFFCCASSNIAYVRVYDPSQTLITSDIDQDVSITFEPTIAGIYYIEIEDWSNEHLNYDGEIGNYSLDDNNSFNNATNFENFVDSIDSNLNKYDTSDYYLVQIEPGAEDFDATVQASDDVVLKLYDGNLDLVDSSGPHTRVSVSETSVSTEFFYIIVNNTNQIDKISYGLSVDGAKFIPQSISVIGPSDTVLTLGQTVTITWNTAGTDPISSVKIELFKDSSLIKVLASSTINDGEMNWAVSNTGVGFSICITDVSFGAPSTPASDCGDSFQIEDNDSSPSDDTSQDSSTTTTETTSKDTTPVDNNSDVESDALSLPFPLSFISLISICIVQVLFIKRLKYK